MAERYRFGGPIPESVKKLKARREYRASSLYAGIKKIRRERAEEERAAQCKRDRGSVATLRLVENEIATPGEPLRQSQADCSSSPPLSQQEGRDRPEQRPTQ